MSSNFINNLRELEHKQSESTKVANNYEVRMRHITEDAQHTVDSVNQSLRGKIVLDPTLDPDPYGLHGIPLSTRLQYMGWT